MDIQKYKQALSEYVSFESISTDPDKLDGINETANWLLNLFTSSGFTAELLNWKGLNPVVFAQYNVDENANTVLVYGHYDVQPASIEDGWESEPFKLAERDGRLFARGVMDNKGQNLIHIYTVLELIKENKLKYNVKFLIEGNEESGGVEELGKLIEQEKDKVKADYMLVSDGELVAGRPAIEASYRGGSSLTIRYKVANNNTHSGLFGGAVPNAAYELSKLLSKVYGEDNIVTFPEFYDGVDEISDDQLKNNSRLAEIGAKEALEGAGYKALRTEGNKYDFYTQTGLRPTMQVTGIKSGYIGNGYSNIVPAVAEAKINLRTAPSQDTAKVVDAIKKFVVDNTPDYVEYEIECPYTYASVKLDRSAPIFNEVKEILKESYNSEVFDYYVGGAIPLIAKMKDLFGINAVSVGLGNEDCNMHGANENLRVEMIEKGLKFSKSFFGRV